MYMLAIPGWFSVRWLVKILWKWIIFAVQLILFLSFSCFFFKTLHLKWAVNAHSQWYMYICKKNIYQHQFSMVYTLIDNRNDVHPAAIRDNFSVSFQNCEWLTQTCFHWEAGSLAVSCFSNIACNTPVVSFIRFQNILNLKYSLVQDNQSTRWVERTSIFLPCYCGRWNIMTCFTRKPCYWSNSYCCIFGLLEKFPGDTCN